MTGRAHKSISPDREWALDHSRRRYRVRRASHLDHPALASGAVTVAHTIVVIRLFDDARIIVSATCASVPWVENSDGFAELRWRLAEAAAQREAGQ